MPIPESQLETWSHQGAVTTAKATSDSIRNALTASSSPIRGKEYEVYLQGSYKNDTNIRGDSDVDIVVQLNETFQYDLNGLSSPEKLAFERDYASSATYHWENFRADVLRALRAYYGSSAVSEGNKSLKTSKGSGRLAADVVVCLQYRRYLHYANIYDQEYVEGIIFYTRRESRRIVNFPKPHYDDGVAKNASSATNGWYKPTVRMFKNVRTYLVDRSRLSQHVAPSYFVECLFYNAPNGAFGYSYHDTFYEILDWASRTDLSGCVCQNEQLYLFGTLHEQWSISSAHQFIDALIDLWNNW